MFITGQEQSVACVKYSNTVIYGHFGDQFAIDKFPWEKTDSAADIAGLAKSMKETLNEIKKVELSDICKTGGRLCKHFTFKDTLGGFRDYAKHITRPPQSWMYVEARRTL